MGFFGFVKNFGGKKVRETGQNIVQALAAWDPETASAAEIQQMEDNLDKLTRQVAEARASYDKEQKEADAIQALYEQRMKAAELLQAKLADAAGDGAAKIETALGELVSALEEMQPDIEREIQEAVEAKEFMNELEEIAKASAQKLKSARQTLERAKKDMQMAKVREERAKEQAERSASLAGLRSETDQLGSALSAMQKSADQANERADAARMKARLLTSDKEGGENELIASAMQEAAGGEEKPTNITERLAALKKK